MTNRNFIESIKIFEKHIPEPEMDKHDLNPCHDQIWFCDYDLVKDEKDEARLLEIGWDNDDGRWHRFV